MDSIIAVEMLITIIGDTLIIWIKSTNSLQWIISSNHIIEAIFNWLDLIEVFRSINKDQKYRKFSVIRIKYDSIANRGWYKINAY